MNLNTFVPDKTSAYISQYDLHIPEMTVRETLDFSARFQGVGTRAGSVTELLSLARKINYLYLLTFPLLNKCRYFLVQIRNHEGSH